MKKFGVITNLIMTFLIISCGVTNRNMIFDDFKSNPPQKIGILIAEKNIFERPSTTGNHFVSSSMYPDFANQGSAMGYQSNSTAEKFINAQDIFESLDAILRAKGYELLALDSIQLNLPNMISTILADMQGREELDLDAVLFLDYSPMFNKYFASKGVQGNNGYSCYYRFSLFDLKTGAILMRRIDVLNADFYFRKNPSNSEMADDLLKIFAEDQFKLWPQK
ncbi:MAG: hypothetical protein ISR95_07990 [Candidatus Marinimicrobia bacterium]|nr:hypothetical protein [FCB group bacterium]MBL7047546.1 hypothetical protein [Candidatus Neomarinimicrobiota bacterium]